MKQSLVETNVEHEHMSQENIASTTGSVEQCNASRVDIPKSQERETCVYSKQTLH